jgi:hypothetical protein
MTAWVHGIVAPPDRRLVHRRILGGQHISEPARSDLTELTDESDDALGQRCTIRLPGPAELVDLPHRGLEPGVEDLQLLPEFGTNTLGLGTNILEPLDLVQLASHLASLSRKASKTVQVACLRAIATGRVACDCARRPEGDGALLSDRHVPLIRNSVRNLRQTSRPRSSVDRASVS